MNKNDLIKSYAVLYYANTILGIPFDDISTCTNEQIEFIIDCFDKFIEERIERDL